MSFDWDKYRILAHRLSKPGGGDLEANLRSAVSRIYYAALASAKRFVTSGPNRIGLSKNAEDHERIWNQFDVLSDMVPAGPKQEQRKDEIQDLMRTGKRLRSARNAADYDDEIQGNLKAWAEEQLERGEWLILTLAEIESEDA